MIVATVLAAAAPVVPTLDIRPHCQTVARNAAPVGDVDSCLKVEEKARAELAAQWGQFAPGDKEHCLRLSRMGVEPTYTELLTCLELTRDARILRQQEPGNPR
jgi:hypothetical protein